MVTRILMKAVTIKVIVNFNPDMTACMLLISMVIMATSFHSCVTATMPL